MTLKTEAQKLRAARALVKKGWCQGAAARTEFGTMVDYKSERATQFCALGACWRVGASTRSLWNMSQKAIVSWNDSKSRLKTDVLALFDKAIKLAEKKP